MSIFPTPCATIGCKRPATHVLTYTNPGERDEPVIELVCKPCGEGYVRRPTLKATIDKLPVTRGMK